MKTVVIHQPDFIPHLSFYERLRKTECLVILDDAIFSTSGWTHRDILIGPNGPTWFSVSIQKCPYQTRICDLKLVKDESWRLHNRNRIKEWYCRFPNFDGFFPVVESLLMSRENHFVTYSMQFHELALKYFNLKPKIIYSSSLNIDSSRNDRLVEICQAVNASHYITGIGSKDYLNESLFSDKGITVNWFEPKFAYYDNFGQHVTRLSWLNYGFNFEKFQGWD